MLLLLLACTTIPGELPGATETCEGVDNDCNPEVEEAGTLLVFADADGDGAGNAADWRYASEADLLWVISDGDCDDADPAVFPGAPEQPLDGVDQDCDGRDVSCEELGGEYEGDLVVPPDGNVAGFCDDYRNIHGDLVIVGVEAATISGLSCLCQVTGDLVATSSAIESFAGLEGLASVSALTLSDLPELRSLAGLESVQAITNVRFEALPRLASLQALGQAEGDVVSLSLLDLPALTSLGGLEGVHTATLADLRDLPVLADASGLGGLTAVLGINVVNAPALATLGWSSLTESGPLRFENVGVVDLSGLGALDAVSSLELVDMPALLTLDGLGPASHLATLRVTGSPALTRLTDFDRSAALTEVELRNNPSLTSLTGLASVTTLETVTLEGNGLTSLAGLSGLETVDTLTVLAEPDLLSLADAAALWRVSTLTVTGGGLVELGFPALESVGQLSLGSLPALTSLEGLNRVNVGTLRLNDLPGLDSLQALAMTTGGVSVYIDACPALVSLDGLGRIEELGMLHLQGNAALSDVSVLTGLEDIEQVEILDNPVLRTADALALCSAYVHRDDWCTVSGNGP